MHPIDAEMSISTLRALVSSDSETRSAARSMVQANREAWKAQCRSALKHEDAVVRHGAVVALGELKFDNGEMVALIRAALRDAQDFVRAEACWVCVSREDIAASCLSEILSLTRDGYWPARQSAVEAIAAAFSWNARVADQIAALTLDPCWNVRCSAADSFGHIYQAVSGSTKTLLAACGDAEAEVRLAAIRSVGELARGQDGIAGALAQALTDESFMAREEAARGLQALSSGALSAVPRLYDQLSSSVQSLRAAAKAALIAIQGHANRGGPINHER